MVSRLRPSAGAERLEAKKAYGVVTALGTKLGERARVEPDLLERVRGTADVDAFRALVRSASQGLVPDTLVASFLDEVVTPAEWVQWRSRLLLQMKLAREGGRRAPGHEAGRGVKRA